MPLKDHCQLIVLNAATRLPMTERGKLFARHLDKACRILPQQLHRIDRIVECRGDVAEDPRNSLIGIAILALLLDEPINDGGGEGGETILTECRLYMQANVLLS